MLHLPQILLSNLITEFDDFLPACVSNFVSTHSTEHSFDVLAWTALIDVFVRNGDVHTCRALLDSGSQLNLNSHELANRLEVLQEKTLVAIADVSRSTHILWIH